MYVELHDISKQFRADLRLAGNQRSKGRGRPRRSARTRSALIAEAPFRDLVLMPADLLCAKIRGMNDMIVLAESFAFELRREQRKSVLRQIGRQMKSLGWTGDEPFPGYDIMRKEEIRSRLSAMDRSGAEVVFSYESKTRGRRDILRESLNLIQSSESPTLNSLSTTPSRRGDVKEALQRMNREDLAEAYRFEMANKRRVVMLRSIRDEIRRRGLISSEGQ